ncbi:MAG: general secretion pathway protein GspB [Desulfuromonadaceae bacterium]
MSYILEALKKSEKKRQGEHSSLAHLATEETPEQERRPPGRPLWPLLLGLALVINAGVMLLIFWPSASRTPDDPAPDTGQLYQRDAASHQPAPSAASDETAAQEESVRQEPSTRVQKTPSTLATARQSDATTTEALPAQADAHTSVPATDSGEAARSTQDPTSSASSTPENYIQTLNPDIAANTPPVHFNNLPLNYRRQLPEMQMSVHVYSESPSGGVVRVNSKMLRPGSSLDGGIRLETITREGAVFSHAGQRFLLPRR